MATYVYASSWGAVSGYAFKFRAFLTYEVTTNNETTYAVKFTTGIQCSTTDEVGYNNLTCTTKEGSTTLYTDTANYRHPQSTDSSARQVYRSTFTRTWTKGTSAVTKTVTATASGSGITSTTATKSFSVPAKTSYKVEFDANGGSGAPATQTKWYGTTLTISSTIPTRTGYDFVGWATSASGSAAYRTGTNHDQNTTYSANAAVKLFAKWQLKTYKIKYYKNSDSASGTIADGTKSYDVDATLSNGTGFTWSLHSIESWNTNSTGTGTRYEKSGTYSANAAVDLYAQWKLDYTNPVLDAKCYRVASSGSSTETDDGEYLYVEFDFEGGSIDAESNYIVPTCVITVDGVTSPYAYNSDVFSDTFTASTDTVVDFDKTYCIVDDSDTPYTYQIVEPAGTENPSSEGWYEKTKFAATFGTYSKDVTHTVNIKIYDSNDSNGTSQNIGIATAIYPIDMIANSSGVFMGIMTPAVSGQVLKLFVDAIYPVGSYYETSDSTFDPNTYFGGTWSLEASGKVHVSAGTGYAIGTTGGAATVTLTTDEMPSHTHIQNAHRHYANNGTDYGFPTYKHNSGAGRVKVNTSSGTRYAWVGTSTSVSSADDSGIEWTSSLTTQIATNQNAGGGLAHENMPPYITVNRWHRTA